MSTASQLARRVEVFQTPGKMDAVKKDAYWSKEFRHPEKGSADSCARVAGLHGLGLVSMCLGFVFGGARGVFESSG